MTAVTWHQEPQTSPPIIRRVDHAPRWLRALGYVLVAAGIGRAVIGNLLREPVNDAQLVPGALIGETLITLGVFALWASYLARNDLRVWLILVAVLTPLVIAGMAVSIVEQGHPREYWTQGPRGWLVVGASMIAYVTTILMFMYVLLAGSAHVLAWLLDLVPPLRRRGAGAAVRDGVRLVEREET